MEIVNWKLAANPVNWLTVFLMVFIASIAMHFVLSSFTTVAEPSQ